MGVEIDAVPKGLDGGNDSGRKRAPRHSLEITSQGAKGRAAELPQQPAAKPAGMTVEFRERGEVNYVKSHWSVSEVLIAALMAYERGRNEWAARYFSRAKSAND